MSRDGWMLFVAVPWGCLRFVIVVFPDHTHLLFCGHLLGNGWPLGSLVCDVFLCFCHFHVWCPGSGVVFDCIDF